MKKTIALFSVLTFIGILLPISAFADISTDIGEPGEISDYWNDWNTVDGIDPVNEIISKTADEEGNFSVDIKAGFTISNKGDLKSLSALNSLFIELGPFDGSANDMNVVTLSKVTITKSDGSIESVNPSLFQTIGGTNLQNRRVGYAGTGPNTTVSSPQSDNINSVKFEGKYDVNRVTTDINFTNPVVGFYLDSPMLIKVKYLEKGTDKELQTENVYGYSESAGVEYSIEAPILPGYNYDSSIYASAMVSRKDLAGNMIYPAATILKTISTEKNFKLNIGSRPQTVIFYYEPSTTEPSTTEPSTTEPSTTEPSTTEPSTTEPSTTEPSTTEPSTTEPSTTEPSTTEPSTTEPSTTDSKKSMVINGNDNNQKEHLKYLPKTGESGSWLITAIGIVTIIGAGVFYIRRKVK